MPNQKISELTAIVTVDTSLDVLPIVDTSANTTKKISPTALKTALALDNVNNTSDANKPVSTAQQDALNAKVTGNTAIVAATKTKITYDAKGLVTAGNILDAADMPMAIDAANIGAGVVSSTEFGYLDGVTSAIQTQLDSKQATLVSGTNIKTINSTSLLGSGDISISANPSGVAGAIQFSNGSAFASDATNLFWDDTNNRLGVGTATPTTTLDVQGSGNNFTTFCFNASNLSGQSLFKIRDDGTINAAASSLRVSSFINDNDAVIGSSSFLSARLGIKGSGSTSATTSLLVQNSAGTERFKIQDDGTTTFNGGVAGTGITISPDGSLTQNNNATGITAAYDGGLKLSGGVGLFVRNATGYNKTLLQGGYDGGLRFSANPSASDFINLRNDTTALLEMVSTTKGFLPPRMTTTQINAIASPAAGLVLYDSTTNKLQCYNGSTWNDLF
jgi:hypothetical protein